MRSIGDIKNEITTTFMANAVVQEKYGFTATDTFDAKFSKVSLESILFYVVACAIWVMESLFNTHQVEVDNKLLTLRPHTANWYAARSKLFQYGSSLQTDSDQYDNSELTDDEVAAQQIVKYAAVSSSQRQVRIKVAKVANDDLASLTTQELAAFSAYIARIKDAGVFTAITSDASEQLKLAVTIYYNPELMDSTGVYLDGTGSNAVETAIKQYLRNIDFDGEFVMVKLIDALQVVKGVEIPHITEAKYRYGSLAWTDIDVTRRPLSGYIRISDSDLTITYVPR